MYTEVAECHSALCPLALDQRPPTEYISLMIKTKTSFSSPTSTYSYDVERKTRTGYDWDPSTQTSTRTEVVYFQVNVYDANDRWINFGFVEDPTNVDMVEAKVQEVVLFIENPGPDLGSRFD